MSMELLARIMSGVAPPDIVRLRSELKRGNDKNPRHHPCQRPEYIAAVAVCETEENGIALQT
jgi:hypothetical protein